jgi:hypothetical protein
VSAVFDVGLKNSSAALLMKMLPQSKKINSGGLVLVLGLVFRLEIGLMKKLPRSKKINSGGYYCLLC